jgi:broad specificity phosphatase PhoE
MPNIDMARHGEAASVFEGHINPGLSKLDKDQANATAKELDAKGSMQVVTSSLARARQRTI